MESRSPATALCSSPARSASTILARANPAGIPTFLTFPHKSSNPRVASPNSRGILATGNPFAPPSLPEATPMLAPTPQPAPIADQFTQLLLIARLEALTILRALMTIAPDDTTPTATLRERRLAATAILKIPMNTEPAPCHRSRSPVIGASQQEPTTPPAPAPDSSAVRSDEASPGVRASQSEVNPRQNSVPTSRALRRKEARARLAARPSAHLVSRAGSDLRAPGAHPPPT